MLKAIRRRWRDVRTIARLFEHAEQASRARGEPSPGSEHFVLAALSLPDGTAAAAFRLLGVDEAAFSASLAAQDAAALAAMGVRVSSEPPPSLPTPPAPRLFNTQPSAAQLMQRMTDAQSTRVDRDLQGADVLLAAAEEVHSACARAFRSLGVTPERLRGAAKEALDESRHAMV